LFLILITKIVMDKKIPVLQMTIRITQVDYSNLQKLMRKQRYHFVNEHTVVKPCLWTRKAILQRRFCYKCLFYGIESHRCIQMSPAAYWCWNDCIHCWRVRPPDVGIPFELSMPKYQEDIDALVDNIIETQRKLLSGYWGNPKADKELVKEAFEPKHVAISLTGEPTLYENLPSLIIAFHRKGLTTFFVTRGVRPDVLERLSSEEPPSQLYISIEAYNKEKYEQINKPLVPRAWELTMRSLEIMSSFPSPTVLRITAIKGINMDSKAVEGFSKIIEIARPKYIEVKAYMHVGSSTQRLTKSNMPSFSDIWAFSEELSKATGIPVRSYAKDSRVVLLSELERPVRHGKGCPNCLWLSKS